MKKVIGIFMAIIMVFLVVSIAFGESMEEEVKEFALDHKELVKFVSESGYGYNIVGDCAYAIGNLGEAFSDVYDFIDNYEEKYIRENWPDFASDVKIEYTYVGMTDNYTIVCVWLTLENGKTFDEYVEGEPALSKMAGLMAFKR